MKTNEYRIGMTDYRDLLLTIEPRKVNAEAERHRNPIDVVESRPGMPDVQRAMVPVHQTVRPRQPLGRLFPLL